MLRRVRFSKIGELDSGLYLHSCTGCMCLSVECASMTCANGCKGCSHVQLTLGYSERCSGSGLGHGAHDIGVLISHAAGEPKA